MQDHAPRARGFSLPILLLVVTSAGGVGGLVTACAPAPARSDAVERSIAETSPPTVEDAGATASADRVELVNGVADRGRDPAVVAIDVGGDGLCSGALVSPRLVLTARHCVSRTTEAVTCPPAGVQVFADLEPDDLSILVGEDIASARRVARAIAIVSPGGVSLCDADIALLVLDEPVVVAKPLPIRPRGPAVGDRLRTVGFGMPRDGDPAGRKLLREHVRVLDVTTAEFTIGEATCSGDSGGPAIDEDTGEVLGVVSRGGPSCEGPGVHNVYTRADTYAWLIEEAFARVAEIDLAEKTDAGSSTAALKPAKRGTRSKPPSDVGGPCTTGQDCAAGVCIFEADRQYCSRPCGAGDRCPTRYHCLPLAGLGDPPPTACTNVR